MSIHWPIIRTCLGSPLGTAVVDDQRSYKRIGILAAAMMLADDLERRVQTEHVGIMLPSSGAFPIAALAVWMLGKVPVPLNFLLKPDELNYIVQDSGIDTIVTAKGMLDFLGYKPTGVVDGKPPAVEGGVKIRLLEEVDFRCVPSPRVPALMDDDALGVLLYTSGTSGRPKGVMLTHGNIAGNIRQILDHITFDRNEVFLGCLPQFHSFGLTALTALPLTVGAKVVYTARFVPQKVVRLFRDHRPSVFIGIPAMFNALLHVRDASREDFASLRIAVSGGEPLPDAVAGAFRERFGVTIAEGYGLTETSPVTNWCRPTDYKPHSVGRPLPRVSQRIVDVETGRDLGVDRDGEVRIKGPNLMKGYYKLPEQTASVIDDRGYFRTGDIGRIDADGHLFITGRLKEMLIIAGENVFPRELEEVLNKHPSIKESGVVGKKDPMRGELPVAFVELKEGETFDEKSVRAFMRERIAAFKIPDEFRVLPALPRNPTGKLMRRELKKYLDQPGGVG